MSWTKQPLSALCLADSPITYGILQPGPSVTDGVLYVRPTEINEGVIDICSLRRTSPEIARRYSKSRLSAGDLLITIVGTIGSVAAVPVELEGANITQSSARIRPNPEVVCARYLCHFLRSPDATRQYEESRLGATVPRLNLHHVRDLQIPVPPLPEQKRIAAILDATDALRAKRRESIRQLDSLLQAIFLDMFGDPVTNPEEWDDSVTLGEIADIASGLTKGRTLRGQSTREVPYLAVVNVQDRRLVLNPLKTIEATDAEIDKYRLQKNDLLLTEGGDRDKLGRGTLWQDELPECIHQNHIFRVRLHDERWLPVFLNWLVGSDRGKRYFLSQAKQTTGIASINLSQLKRFPLLLPPFHLQQRFASIVEAVESHKVRLKTQYAELESLFASLQVQAFSGVLYSVPTSRQHASA